MLRKPRARGLLMDEIIHALLAVTDRQGLMLEQVSGSLAAIE
jgi:hypothetical protein